MEVENRGEDYDGQEEPDFVLDEQKGRCFVCLNDDGTKEYIPMKELVKEWDEMLKKERAESEKSKKVAGKKKVQGRRK